MSDEITFISDVTSSTYAGPGTVNGAVQTFATFLQQQQQQKQQQQKQQHYQQHYQQQQQHQHQHQQHQHQQQQQQQQQPHQQKRHHGKSVMRHSPQQRDTTASIDQYSAARTPHAMESGHDGQRGWSSAVHSATPSSSPTSPTSPSASSSPPPQPPPPLFQAPLQEYDGNFEYTVPADASGFLAPRIPPKTPAQQRGMFKSRVLFLLLVQAAFFTGTWCADISWPVPEAVLGTCAFVGVFFLGISVLSLHSFKRMHPFSYVCAFMYNFFSIPYFIVGARFFEVVFVGQFMAYYCMVLLVALLTSTLLRAMDNFMRTLLLAVILTMPVPWIVYFHYIEQWLGPRVPVILHHSCFSAYYAALSVAVYVLYCINYPVDRYNCYDYVVAFIDVNLFGGFRLVRRIRYSLSVSFILLFMAALIAEKTIEFRLYSE